MDTPITPAITSEIGELEAVILHTPGPEVENMTPGNAERALYSDILNLSVATEEYQQFKGVMQKMTRTFQVKDLLTEVLNDNAIKQSLTAQICEHERVADIQSDLLNLNHEELASQLIEGVTLKRNSLTTYLSEERYALRPLHNFFFIRDASVTVYDQIMISKMANRVRERESIIMDAIFSHSPNFSTKVMNPDIVPKIGNKTFIEGGDVLIAREDILILGAGARTSSQGIDFLANQLKKNKKKIHLIVQQLPQAPESFIHLDMVFTLLDRDTCMVYDPVISYDNRLATILMTIENRKVMKISRQPGLLPCLKSLGMDLKSVSCGGTDLWQQEREQWHSGANFFALGPGKLLGYARNVHTLEALSNIGYSILSASDVIHDKVNPNTHEKYVITIEGSELSRGGGGARCMTMPVRRKDVVW